MFQIVGTELFGSSPARQRWISRPTRCSTSPSRSTTSQWVQHPDDTAPLAITITDVNEPPTVALANTTTTFPEDTDTTSAIKVADIVVTDDALGTNTLSHSVRRRMPPFSRSSAPNSFSSLARQRSILRPTRY